MFPFSVLNFLTCWALLHPIHISTTEIEYSAKDRSLQVVVRIFSDDLEAAVRRELKQPELNLLNPSGGATAQALIAAYVKRHLRIRPEQGAYYQFTFVGFEENGFAVVCYLEAENTLPPTALIVFNDAIMDIYKDQSNIINVTFGETLKSARLTPDNALALLKP